MSSRRRNCAGRCSTGSPASFPMRIVCRVPFAPPSSNDLTASRGREPSSARGRTMDRTATASRETVPGWRAAHGGRPGPAVEGPEAACPLATGLAFRVEGAVVLSVSATVLRPEGGHHRGAGVRPAAPDDARPGDREGARPAARPGAAHHRPRPAENRAGAGSGRAGAAFQGCGRGRGGGSELGAPRPARPEPCRCPSALVVGSSLSRCWK